MHKIHPQKKCTIKKREKNSAQNSSEKKNSAQNNPQKKNAQKNLGKKIVYKK